MRKYSEKRSFYEVIIEIFGDTFGLHWFIPFKQGGYYRYFSKYVKTANYTLNENVPQQQSKTQNQEPQSSQQELDYQKKNN